jgi:hypothetical protein
MGILESLIKNNCEISFVCAGKKSKLYSSDINYRKEIKTYFCDPNDEIALQNFGQKIDWKLDAAIFDTFITEEMFR